MSDTQHLCITQIRTDGGTQMRTEINSVVVDEYADLMRLGHTFPAVVVYFDGNNYWLADGFHRVAASHRAFGRDCEIATEIRTGTLRDAILYAVGANTTHGLRRTNADKRRAVQALLLDPEWEQWSDSEIARACCVDDKTVGNLRRALFGDKVASANRIVRRGDKVYTMNVTNIASASRQREQQDLTVKASAEAVILSIKSVEHLLTDAPEFAIPIAEAISALTEFHNKHFNRPNTRLKNLLVSNNARLRAESKALREEVASLKRALEAKRAAEPKLSQVMVEHSL